MSTSNPDQWQVTEQDIQSLEHKLQTLAGALPPGERDALDQLIALAAGVSDVQGYVADAPLFLSGMLDLRAVGVRAGRSRYCCAQPAAPSGFVGPAGP